MVQDLEGKGVMQGVVRGAVQQQSLFPDLVEFVVTTTYFVRAADADEAVRLAQSEGELVDTWVEERYRPDGA